MGWPLEARRSLFPDWPWLYDESSPNRRALHIRHGYRSKKFPAATYVRDYFINFTKSPKKLKKYVIFSNRKRLEVL